MNGLAQLPKSCSIGLKLWNYHALRGAIGASPLPYPQPRWMTAAWPISMPKRRSAADLAAGWPMLEAEPVLSDPFA
jgi:hypothetical protein